MSAFTIGFPNPKMLGAEAKFFDTFHFFVEQ
jgi:hypothetical protein